MTLTKPAQVIRYERTLGMTVMVGKGFYCPNDLSFGADGRIYVLNRSIEARAAGNGMRVAVCDADDGYYGSFGKFGEGWGEFIWPAAIAAGPAGRVYVADEHLQKVMIFSYDGEFIDEWGRGGSRPGELDTPSGMTTDADGNLFISDTYNHRIQVFEPDGTLVRTFGSEGGGDGELTMPWRLSIGPDSNVYVADWGNDRVCIFTREGDFVASFGESGTGEGQLTKPADVVADRSGNIYVCDWGNERVQVFDREGRFLQLTLGESGVSPWAQNFLNINAEEGEARSRADLDKPDIPLPDPDDRNLVSAHIEKYFWAPMALAISPDNRLLVLESNRHRIQIFEIVG